MKNSKVLPMKATPNGTKVQGSVEIDQIMDRLEELEGLCNQVETALATALKDKVTFDALVARLTGGSGASTEAKKVRKVRAKRELSPEEKAAFHARMVAGRLAKEQARQAAAKNGPDKK